MNTKLLPVTQPSLMYELVQLARNLSCIFVGNNTGFTRFFQLFKNLIHELSNLQQISVVRLRCGLLRWLLCTLLSHETSPDRSPPRDCCIIRCSNIIGSIPFSEAVSRLTELNAVSVEVSTKETVLKRDVDIRSKTVLFVSSSET